MNKFRKAQSAHASAAGRRKIFIDDRPDTVYAIGDVHGSLARYDALERKIVADAATLPGTKMLILLGDYVDRGPQSAAMLDRLTGRAPASIERICLAGNHEDVMLDFLANPSAQHRWLDFGGLETLHSYGIYDIPNSRSKLRLLLQSHIPDEHIEFLRDLPSLVSMPDYCFVHAGIDESRPLVEQPDDVLLWKRPSEDISATELGITVVHGHTVVRMPERTNNRINIDTGAFMSGVLTAVRLSKDSMATFISSN